MPSHNGSDNGAEGETPPAPLLRDVPTPEFDALLRQLINRVQGVAATQGRLRGLLHANQTIVGNLTLPVLLRRIVQANRVLVEGRGTTAELSLAVAADGVGLGDIDLRSGLANLRQRAELDGGSLTLSEGDWERTATDTGGTRLVWPIPLI